MSHDDVLFGYRLRLFTLAEEIGVRPACRALGVHHSTYYRWKAKQAREPVTRADLGRPYLDVSVPTSDGLRLAGWYVPSRNGAAVIAFPGRTGPVKHARMLVRHGYGVLLLDRRGEGESEGDFNARGWGGEPDLRAAVAYLRQRPDVTAGRIGGLGLSVGGELLLQAAASDDAGLRAVVSEGAGLRSAAEQKHRPGAPSEPLRWIAPITTETMAGVVLSDHLPPPDLADLMPRIAPRPVLLIRGMEGNPDETLNRVYREAGGSTASLWEVEGAGHTGAISVAPAEYERRVVGFFDRTLRERARQLQVVVFADEFLPTYDVSDEVATVVRAEREAVWTALVDADLIELGRGAPLVGVLGAFRILPELVGHLLHGEQPPKAPDKIRLRDMAELPRSQGGWLLLGERPSEAIALGLVGKFWRPVIEYAEVAPADFRDFAQPGYAKTVYELTTRSIEEGTLLSGLMRTATTDEHARRWFRRYWTFGVGSGAHVLVNSLLESVRERAEHPPRP